MSRPMSKPVVSIVFDASTLSRIDRIADRMRCSRSSIVELLCLDALERQSSDTLKVGIIHPPQHEAART
jgi:predicted transcriptional regulator